MEVRAEDDFEFFNITAPIVKKKVKGFNSRTRVHHAVDEFNKWKTRRPDPQPVVLVIVLVCKSGYS